MTLDQVRFGDYISSVYLVERVFSFESVALRRGSWQADHDRPLYFFEHRLHMVFTCPHTYSLQRNLLVGASSHCSKLHFHSVVELVKPELETSSIADHKAYKAQRRTISWSSFRVTLKGMCCGRCMQSIIMWKQKEPADWRHVTREFSSLKPRH